MVAGDFMQDVHAGDRHFEICPTVVSRVHEHDLVGVEAQTLSHLLQPLKDGVLRH